MKLSSVVLIGAAAYAGLKVLGHRSAAMAKPTGYGQPGVQSAVDAGTNVLNAILNGVAGLQVLAGSSARGGNYGSGASTVGDFHLGGLGDTSLGPVDVPLYTQDRAAVGDDSTFVLQDQGIWAQGSSYGGSVLSNYPG